MESGGGAEVDERLGLESEWEEAAPRRKREGGEDGGDSLVHFARGRGKVEKRRPLLREGRYCFPPHLTIMVVQREEARADLD